jgi:hypothetical protein
MPSQAFLDRAEACVRRAESATTEVERGAWLTIAEQWRRLALRAQSDSDDRDNALRSSTASGSR